MKALIVYSTSRGTTAKIAETIAEGMNEAGASASVIRLEFLKLVPHRLQSADVLGVGSPVYFLREPEYMTEFLSDLPSLEGRRAFVFCTTGMNRVGETLHRMRSLLLGRGAKMIGAKSFRSAMSYYPYRKRGLGNPDHLPDDSELRAAGDFGRRMVGVSEPGAVELDPVSRATQWKAKLLANRTFRAALFPRTELKVEACTGYGSCLSRCPYNGLEREDGREIPFYTRNCVHCLECVAWCPRDAIVTDSAIKEWVSTLSYRLGIH